MNAEAQNETKKLWTPGRKPSDRATIIAMSMFCDWWKSQQSSVSPIIHVDLGDARAAYERCLDIAIEVAKIEIAERQGA